MTTAAPSIELMRLINGYQVSQALHVAATLGLADQLKDGPKSYDAVAKACGAHPPSLYRLLRALATVGVFHETDNKEFSLTQLGLCLASDAPGSTRNYARWIGTPGQFLGQSAPQHQIRRKRIAIYPRDGCVDISHAAPSRAGCFRQRDDEQFAL
jgi:methyltransferase family protein